MKGFENTYIQHPFSPRFLDTWRGVKVNRYGNETLQHELKLTSINRYMDLQKTNGNNMAHWNQRTPKTAASFDFTTRTTPVDIKSIVDAGIIPPSNLFITYLLLGSIESNFSSSDWKVVVTTKTPHVFVTGQTVTVNVYPNCF